MRIPNKTVRHLGAGLLALSFAAVAAPAPLPAQDPPPNAEEQKQEHVVEKEEMVRYVTIQLARDDLQEEAVEEMARIHSEDGRAQLRRNLTEAIAAVHEEHGMPLDRYQTLTFLISSDTEVRELFETTLEEIRGEGGGETEAA